MTRSYRLPAEWEPHSAIWLAWPHDGIAFPGRVEKAELAVTKIISAIHTSERVELLVLDESMQNKASKMLADAGVDLKKITFRQADYLGGWLRDCGGLWVTQSPLFSKGGIGGLKLVNFFFNTWGNKFPDLQIDAKLPEKISQWTGVPIENVPVIIEGGSIDVNGQGFCLTTEQCLLNENRNLGKTKKDLEKCLKDYLGVEKTIWLFEGLVNDHTDGHIDELARFVDTNKIVCAYEENEKDENYTILKNNYETLESATNLEGRPFELVKLPMPHVYFKDAAVGLEGGERAAASYANFYIGNSVILVPQFNDPNDAKALEILAESFPNRKVVGVDCSDILYGGGAVHCLTQQQPV